MSRRWLILIIIGSLTIGGVIGAKVCSMRYGLRYANALAEADSLRSQAAHVDRELRSARAYGVELTAGLGELQRENERLKAAISGGSGAIADSVVIAGEIGDGLSGAEDKARQIGIIVRAIRRAVEAGTATVETEIETVEGGSR